MQSSYNPSLPTLHALGPVCIAVTVIIIIIIVILPSQVSDTQLFFQMMSLFCGICIIVRGSYEAGGGHHLEKRLGNWGSAAC